MENYILVGNVIAFFSAALMIVMGFIKNKKTILYVQNIQMITAGISNLVLGSFSGIISSLMGCIRNTLCYKDKFGLKEKIIIGLLATVFTIYFNNLGVIGLLPLVVTILYIIFMNTKSVVKFKLLIAITTAMWLIHDLYIKSYVYAAFDFGAIIANLISIIQIKVFDKKENA